MVKISHKCPLCGNDPTTLSDLTVNEEGQPIGGAYLDVCFCISGQGSTFDEARIAWNGAVEGFIHMMQANGNFESNIIKPKSSIITDIN